MNKSLINDSCPERQSVLMTNKREIECMENKTSSEKWNGMKMERAENIAVFSK